MTKIVCIICMETFHGEDTVHVTFCGHLFHFHCLEQWRLRSTNCPECRKELPQHHKVFFHFDDDEEKENADTFALNTALIASEHENSLQQLKDIVQYLEIQNEACIQELKKTKDLLVIKNDELAERNGMNEAHIEELERIKGLLVIKNNELLERNGILDNKETAIQDLEEWNKLVLIQITELEKELTNSEKEREEKAALLQNQAKIVSELNESLIILKETRNEDLKKICEIFECSLEEGKCPLEIIENGIETKNDFLKNYERKLDEKNCILLNYEKELKERDICINDLRQELLHFSSVPPFLPTEFYYW